MLCRVMFQKILCLALVVITVDAVGHSLTRGDDHRSLQGFQPQPWLKTETVCRKSGMGRNRTYKTRTITNALWLFYEMMGRANGVKGSCEEVCPCGETGVCMSLPGEKSADSSQIVTTFQCSCIDGTTSSGSPCTSSTSDAPEPCGGFAGTLCSDQSAECIDDPSDDCDPKNGGADCIGICVPTCGGFTPAPQPGCPSESICIDNPNTPDCSIAADCTGVCSPLPSCNLNDGIGCPEGYSCTVNESVDCDNSLDCPGKCVQSCAGFTTFPQAPCPAGTFCVDNPATPDCLIAADCPGVCLPPPKCSTKTGEGCREGFSCTLDPNTVCIALVGFDCPGICAPTCAGSSELQAPCPDGTTCVDNPATPDCSIAADCTGVCLAPPSCSVITNEGCSDGFSCTFDPNIACIALVGVECPGICVPTCAGGRGNTLDCPFGLYCVDNPATPGCVIAADCTGVCLPPSECDVKSNEGCTDSFVCTIDNTRDCPDVEGSTCPGICAPSCAGGAFPNVQCPDGTECVDNPATPDCLIAADCVGVCAVPSV